MVEQGAEIRTRGLLVLAAALTLSLGAACSASPDARPNVLVILTDDHAVSMMSAYGSTRAETPNIDRIANEGALFRNSFVTNSICSPSRASLLTGKYSHANGVRENDVAFDGAQATFPKLLQAAGYETALIGKWHLGSDPTGFDYWNILPGQGSYRDPEMLEMGKLRKRKGYVTDLLTDDALAWLRGRDRSKPFLLMQHHKAPHAAWVPSEDKSAHFADETAALPETFDANRSGRTGAVLKTSNRIVPDLLRRWILLGESFGKKAPDGLTGIESREWLYQEYVRDYRRVLLSVDESVGRLLDYLDAEGLSENTIVLYTSDNGLFLGEYGMVDKRLMYEESLRVPLAVRYPATVERGSGIDAFALNVDLAPTILDFAGVAPSEALHGRSLRGWLEGEQPADWRRSLYYHYYEEAGYYNVTRHYGVRTERFKLIRYYGSYRTSSRTAETTGPVDEWELIDLQADPHELRSVYADPRYAKVVVELKAELARLRKELDVPADES